MKPERDIEKLYTPGEVAALLRVNRKTVANWARAGKIPVRWTVGGHRRYPASFVDASFESLTRAPGGEATAEAEGR
jgi:excisionase family DNA binding protein